MGSAPELLEELVDQVVITPDDAILECDISSGDPPAKLTWYKDDKEIRSSKRIDITYQDDVAMLTVHDTTFKDGGHYRCEAVNKLGRVSTDCTLVVESKSL